jgi:crossover junction endodeoxyribonuclease RuvC
MTLTYVGIDPGLSGAIVAVSNGQILACTDMPTIEVRGKRRIDIYNLREELIAVGPVHRVVVEEVQGVQGSGATSAFSFGYGAGAIAGLLVALERPWKYVTPQRWTKDLGVSRDKGAHRQMAQRLFPVDAHLFARVKDDGRADAALLAHYASRYA